MEERADIIRKMIREAYLSVAAAEEDALVEDVVRLLENVEVLAAIPAEEARPAGALAVEALRADEPEPSLPAPRALANAPASHDGFVAVPKMIVKPGEDDRE